MLAQDIDPRVFEEVIADIIPPCESIYHGSGHPLAMNHDGPAAWMQIGFCIHTTGYRCDRYVQGKMARAARDPNVHWECTFCNLSREPGKFIPLSDVR